MEEPGRAGAQRPQESVLLIDEDFAVRDALQHIVLDAGFEPIPIGVDDEGLRLARSMRPSLIIVGAMMPSRKAWEILVSLKADDTLRHLPIVMLTVTNDRNAQPPTSTAAHLAKPALREALAGVLKQYRAWLQDGAAIGGAPSEVLLESRRVTAAGTGALSAVRSLLDKRQEVIVLDLQIPSSELLEFVDSVGRLPGISGTQVVALVGLSIDPADEAQLQENGIAILSTRDRPPSEIREAIERLASREPVLAGG